MKKTLVAFALMSAAGFAQAAETYTPGTATTRFAVPTTFTYTVAATRAERLFVKNEFDFTLSTNVIMNADEDPDGRFMSVGTGNTMGRNIYVGHSDGGSVNSCGDPLTAAEAKVEGAIATELGSRWDATNDNGCVDDDV